MMVENTLLPSCERSIFLRFYRESLSLSVDPSRTAGVIACVAAVLLVYVDNSLIYQYVLLFYRAHILTFSPVNFYASADVWVKEVYSN